MRIERSARVRKRQCKACPWRKATVPGRDIPGGYSAELHRGLACCQAAPAEVVADRLRVMACHESRTGREYPCVGWLVHQLGPGNNIPLRLQGLDGRFAGLRVVGVQHESMEAMLATAGVEPDGGAR